MTKLISYIRVSTARQGESQLGLEAQESAVEAYARSNKGKVVAEYREIESGKVKNRPQLQAAIAACRQHSAILVVAKLDRLARNVAFTSALMESGVEFVACDMPTADKFSIHILAAVAEKEAAAISERTKAALAALKRRGVKLGSPVASKTAAKARRANVAKAAAYLEDIRPLAERKRKAGKTLQEIADFLNGRGLRTRRGSSWKATTVMRLLAS